MFTGSVQEPIDQPGAALLHDPRYPRIEFKSHRPPAGAAHVPSTLQRRRYSLIRLFRCASLSRFLSSGVSLGRSILIVSLLSLPVNLNATSSSFSSTAVPVSAPTSNP